MALDAKLASMGCARRMRGWHVDRAAVLAEQLANDGKDHEDVAIEIAQMLGWI